MFYGAGSRKKIPGAGAASKQDGSETLAVSTFKSYCTVYSEVSWKITDYSDDIFLSYLNVHTRVQ